MKKRKTYERLQNPNGRTPLSERWPIIILCLLFVWPLGLVLLILKILRAARGGHDAKVIKQTADVPYQKYKSRERKLSYLEKQKKQKKMNWSAAIMTVLLLALGCYGLTRDYLHLFLVRHFDVEFIQDFVCHCLFLLAGTYLASRIYTMFLRQHQARQILATLHGRPEVPLASLAQAQHCEVEDLYELLVWMISMDCFGERAEVDMEKNILYCTRAAAADEED